jgi:hypothetical protein
MKKILNLILVLMLLTSVASLALANKAGDTPPGAPYFDRQRPPYHNETNNQTYNWSRPFQPPFRYNGTDNETEHDIEIMNVTLGAEIRLLQLEKAILTNLLEGTMTVQVLKGVNISTTSLETILTDLKAVLLEVRAVNVSTNYTIQAFIELKNESKNLTTEFRDTLRSLVTNETIQQIKEHIRAIYSQELQNCTLKIRSKIRQFNSNQLYHLYGIIGETNTSLINSYINGNLTLNQTKQQIHKIVNQLTKDKQQMIFMECKEDNIKRRVWSHAAMNEYRQHGYRYGGPGRHQ